LKFTKSRSGGFISFGNQELRENILNCARYWENYLTSSASTTEWTYRLRFEISVVMIFVIWSQTGGIFLTSSIR
jgi:hypothetical protein